jgi:D-inositol-3-phosphate glycosyltransferase
MIDRVAYLSLHSCPLMQPGSGDAGGMNVYIKELSLAMADHGVDVSVYTRRTDEDTPDVVEVVPGFKVFHVTAGPPMPLAVRDLPGLVGEFTESTLAWVDVQAALPDIIHSHYWLSGWAGVLLKEKLNVPLANSFHTLGRVKDLSRHPDDAPEGAIRTLTEEEVIARSDCVVASTPYEFDDLLEHYSADPAALCTSPPGIRHDIFRPGDKTEARMWAGLGDHPLIVFAGRIQPLKGIDTVIQALARLQPASSPAQLVVIGGPSGNGGEEELTRLHHLVDELDLAGRVHFVPPVAHDQLASFYQAADIVIMPSRSETFGLVAAEAQACGTPVVAANVGGLPYIIENHKSGLLVTGHDPDDYATAIDAILRDPQLADLLSRGALENSKRFSWKATVSRLLELYDGISGR